MLTRVKSVPVVRYAVKHWRDIPGNSAPHASPHQTGKAVAYQLDYSVNGEKIRTAVGIKNQIRIGTQR